MRSAFTMIELVFVIVILGILAAVAMPRLAATRDDALTSSLAQNIMTGAGEIAAYATAKGVTEDDLTVMSNGLKSLVDTGNAVNDAGGAKVTVAFGAVSDCITVEVTNDASNDVLTITEGAAGDPKCDRLHQLVNTEDYPMLLRGLHVQE